VALRSFAAMCRRLQTSADSPFTRDWLCSAVAADGGVTLFGRRFIASRGAEREERVLEDDEVAPLLEQWFGVRARWSGDRWLPADPER
jgi:arylamine N-acetyltransferase